MVKIVGKSNIMWRIDIVVIMSLTFTLNKICLMHFVFLVKEAIKKIRKIKLLVSTC